MNIKTKFSDSFKELTSVKSITMASMLLAVIVVLGYFANFTLALFPMVKISFAFLPKSIAAYALGPVVAGIVGALGDVISFFLNPVGGAYFPGWTFNAFLTGLIYGIFLYKNEVELKNIILAKIVVLIIVEIFFATLWLNIQFGFPFMATLLTRALSKTLSSPIEVAIIYFVSKAFKRLV